MRTDGSRYLCVVMYDDGEFGPEFGGNLPLNLAHSPDAPSRYLQFGPRYLPERRR